MAKKSSSSSPPLSSVNCSNKPHVTIARLSLHAADKEYAYLVNLLSDNEKERSLRPVPEVRRRAVVSRGRLRVLLGRLTGVPPEEVLLKTGHFGKPYLGGSHQDSIQFNVAHSMDEAVIALSRQCTIGVDVEKRKTTHDQKWARLMAPTILSEIEMKQRFGASDELEPEEILDCWVAKEAVLKAIGTGIGDKLRVCQLPSNLPEFRISVDSVVSSCRLAPVVFQQQNFFTGSGIGTALIDLSEGIHLAIACPGQACELAVRSFGRVLQDGLVEG
jgi:4'-phosphopantetheinyl transferase